MCVCISVIIFYDIPFLCFCYILLKFFLTSSNKQLALSNWKIFSNLKLAACTTSDLVLLLVLVKWKGWETKSHSHLGAGLQEAAGEVGIHKNSSCYLESLCSLTLRADNKAMGDFNNGKFTIPPRLKSKKGNTFLLSTVFFFIWIFILVFSYRSLAAASPFVSHCTNYQTPFTMYQQSRIFHLSSM